MSIVIIFTTVRISDLIYLIYPRELLSLIFTWVVENPVSTFHSANFGQFCIFPRWFPFSEAARSILGLRWMQHLYWFPYLQYSVTCDVAAPQLNQGSSLGMVTGWATQEFLCSIPRKGKRFLKIPKRPDQLYGPPTLVFSWFRWALLQSMQLATPLKFQG